MVAAVLPAASSSSLLDGVRRLTDALDTAYAAVPHLDDDALLLLRAQAHEVNAHLWPLVCACDYEATRRVSLHTTGRVDDEGAGRMAAYRAVATEARVGTSTVRRHVALYETFLRDGDAPVLRAEQTPALSKRFYVEALSAPDPHAALDHFRQRLDADPNYSTRDAAGEVRAWRGGAAMEDAAPPAPSYAERQALRLVERHITALEATTPTESDDYRDGWLDALLALRRRLGASSS